MKDLTNGALDEAKKYAKEIGNSSLENCLKRLEQVEKNYAENGKPVETFITTDFADYSFYFWRETVDEPNVCVSNGGIIFHGKHDNGGDGGAPTFSVNLTPCNGWQIHT